RPGNLQPESAVLAEPARSDPFAGHLEHPGRFRILTQHGDTGDAVGLQVQARIAVLEILDRAAQGAQRHDPIRVRNPPVTSWRYVSPRGKAGEREPSHERKHRPVAASFAARRRVLCWKPAPG